MATKKAMDLDEFDFGFEIVDENELEAVQVATKAVNETSAATTDLEQKLETLYNSIIPLLKNLKANPDKDYILWPDRGSKIDAFKARIDKIVGDSVEYKDI